MKKLFLVLSTLTAFNFVLADENTPVNFHTDQRKGQVNISIKMISGGVINRFDEKLCFIQDGLRENPISSNSDPDCSTKKIKDTVADLEYLVTCTAKPDIHMHWTRISANELSFQSKSIFSEVTSTYKYVGINCDSDAIRK